MTNEMTNEEAIDLLDNLIGMIEDNHNSDYDTAFKMAIKALETIPKYKDTYNKGWDDGAKATYEHLKMCEEEQEPCEDCISRKSIKQKLQEHHDFFVNAYGGFSNLPQNDKSRVDEISNCIAMVVNEPSVNPQDPKTGYCKDCKYFRDIPYHIDICIQHTGLCPKGDWYCADFEPQERRDKE